MLVPIDFSPEVPNNQQPIHRFHTIEKKNKKSDIQSIFEIYLHQMSFSLVQRLAKNPLTVERIDL